VNAASGTERLAVVVNPAAGRGKAGKSVDTIRSLLRNRPGVEIVVPSSPEDTSTQLSRLASEVDRLIVVGGDGMVHAAAQHTASRQPETVLGIVGLGTGNDFATALGLATDLEAGLEQALGEPIAVDALSVGSSEARTDVSASRPTWVTTVATFGFSAQVNERAERMSFPRGSSRYTVATLLETPKVASVAVEMSLDGSRSNHDVMMAAIANTAMFGGGMRIAPDASHSDGLLDVVLIGEVSRLTLLRVLPRAFSGGHVGHPAVSVSTGSWVEFAAEGSVRMRGDGEAVSQLPVRVELVKGALLVAGANG